LQATGHADPKTFREVLRGEPGQIVPGGDVDEVGVRALLPWPPWTANSDAEHGDVAAVPSRVGLGVVGKPTGDADDVEVHGALLAACGPW
jgi:hypothetical protein